MFLRRNQWTSSKKPVAQFRKLKFELLEERILNTVETIDNLLTESFATPPPSVAAMVAPVTPASATFSVVGNASTNGSKVQLSVSSSNAGGISGLKYTWSLLKGPPGAKATFSTNSNASAKDNLVSFNACGSYTLQIAIEGTGLPLRKITKDIVVSPTLTSFIYLDSAGQTVSSTSQISVRSRNYTFSVKGIDQFGNAMSTSPNLTWSASKIPDNSGFDVAGSGGALVAGFNRVGQYLLVGRCGSLPAKEILFNVVSSASFVSASELNGAAIRTQSPLEIIGSTFRATAYASDQFGVRLSQQPTINWTASPASGSCSVKLNIDSNNATFEFSQSGKYTLKAQYGNIQVLISANVTIPVSLLANLKVSQSAVSILSGTSQVLSVQALDQFEKVLATQPVFSWSATGGTITAGSSSNSATFVAGNQAGNYFVTVRSGSLSKLISVKVLSKDEPILDPIQTPSLANLVRSLYVDKCLSRADAITILRSTAQDGVVDASEFADLTSIFATSTKYVMPDYVSVLAKNVVGTNAANKSFQKASLGNLQAGSSAVVMNHLIDKWFLGVDVPEVTNPSYSYSTVAGQLFNGTPSHLDTRQGMLGDCYLIASFGSLADSNPDAVRNMFIDNGDGTYTVRFYSKYGNGQTAGIADYVTVNRQLPTDARGLLVYSNTGSYANDRNLSIWIALAEKAYAQWNETGNEGRDGTNRYGSINGGNPYYVFSQVIGYEASNYAFSDANKQTLINVMTSRKAVVLGTNVSVSTPGLVGCHAYMMVGYTASNDSFTLYNPWGFCNPNPLTWAQLKKDGGGFTVVDTAFSLSNNSMRLAQMIFRSNAFDGSIGLVEMRVDGAIEKRGDALYSVPSTPIDVEASKDSVVFEKLNPSQECDPYGARHDLEGLERSILQHAELVDKALLSLLFAEDSSVQPREV